MATAKSGTTAAVGVGLLACAFLVTAIYFACLQNVWIDEATQLSGAALSPARMLAWLAGGQGPMIPVPPDRTPPVSYILDAACNAMLCQTALHFRLLHLLITLSGAGLLLAAIARRLGGVAVIVSAAVLFLAPKLVEVAVEIRAYPIFFALTCVQIALLAEMTEGAQLRGGRLLLFSAIGLMAIYTHFFGLVSTMALFGGLFVTLARRWREVGMIGGSAVVVLALSAGLQPFVAGANAISLVPVAAGDTNSVPQFMLKLIGHPATLLSLPVAFCFFAAFAVIIAVAIVRTAAGTNEGWRTPRSATFALVVALALGLAVTLAASMLVHGFDALKTSYSIWAFPLLAWLAGAACAPAGRDAPQWVSRLLIPLGRVAATVFGVAALATQALFLAHAGWFVHGPESAIVAAAGTRANGVAIVYRGDWAYGYFPTLWRYQDRMQQWVETPDGMLHRLTHAAADPHVAVGDPFAGDRRVVMVDISRRRYRDLVPLLHGQPALPQMEPAVLPIGFGVVSRQILPGLYWTTVTVLEKEGR